METYNYNKLNEVIKNQYSKIEQPEKTTEEEKTDYFLNQFSSIYNNPSLENIGKSVTNILLNNPKSIIYDDRSLYTYISDNI